MRILGKRLLALASLAATAALVLSACGGEKATPTPPPPTATTRPQATATTAAPQPTATRPAATAPAATTAPQATATTAAPQATATPRPTTAAATPTPTPAPLVRPFPQAKYGGVVTKRMTEPPIGWDPHINRTENVQDILQPVFDQLLQMDPYNQSEAIPQLATSWKASTDALTWTFELRKGIKFHNGTPLTAQDFKYTYEQIVMNPPKGVLSAFQGELLALGSVEAPNDSTLILKLKEADAAFLSGLGFGRMVIMSKALVEAGGRTGSNSWPPIGTGPFKAKEYNLGVSTEIVKNEAYWVPGRPFLNGMKFFVIPDEGTAFAAFLAGQVNFGLRATPKQVEELKSRLGAKVTIQSTPTLTWRHLEINALVKPFDDIRVRQAIGYAIDKVGFGTLLNERPAIGGYIAPGTGWELPEAELKKFPGYDPDLKANIAKAKQLMKDAGYPNGFKTEYYVRNHPTYIAATTAVQGFLKEIGITGEMKLVESTIYFEDKIAGKLGWQLAAGGLRTAGTDPNSAYREFHLPTGPRASHGLKDQKLVDLFNAQNRETDPAKRKQKVWEMEKYWLPMQGMVVGFYQFTDYAWYSTIKNFEYHVNYASNLQFRDVWME